MKARLAAAKAMAVFAAEAKVNAANRLKHAQGRLLVTLILLDKARKTLSIQRRDRH